MNPSHVMTAACLADALAALDAAPPGPLLLVSPPQAGASLGPGWWLALVSAARAGSGRDFTDLLDCGDASGRALEALQLGLRGLVLAPDAPGRQTVAARAALLGAIVLDDAPSPTPAAGP
ncbi:hypothetical protein [Endobacter medicaginis]